MVDPAGDRSSSLFLVRVWQEGEPDDGTEWRGRVQHVMSGQSRIFHDWPSLIDSLANMLAALREAEARRSGRQEDAASGAPCSGSAPPSPAP